MIYWMECIILCILDISYLSIYTAPYALADILGSVRNVL